METTVVEALRERARRSLGMRMATGNSPYMIQHGRPQHLSQQGAEIAEMVHLVRNGESGDVDWCKAARHLNSIGGARAWTLAKKLDAGGGYILQCGGCGDWIAEYDQHTTTSGIICVNCCDEQYTYSECMGDYIPSDDAFPVYNSINAYRGRNPDDYCTGCHGDRHFHEYDDVFFADENDMLTLQDEDNPPEEEEERDNDGLRDYHCADRNFVEQNATPAIPALGVELEVFSDYRREAVSEVKDEFPDFYYELDGSLDDNHGFEIITQPLGVTEWGEVADRLLDALSNCRAYTQPNTRLSYGIHISVSRRHLSPFQEGRLLLFMSAEDNLNFIRAIAQREALFGGSRAEQFGSLPQEQQLVRHIGGLSSKRKKPIGLGKYSSINLDGDRAEFRIFQSTLYLPSFMKNLEFVWALIEWTSTKSATGCVWQHTEFVKWLGQKQGGEQRYPHLFAFLRKPTYSGIGFNMPIRNTWGHMLPRQNSRSRDTIVGDADMRYAA